MFLFIVLISYYAKNPLAAPKTQLTILTASNTRTAPIIYGIKVFLYSAFSSVLPIIYLIPSTTNIATAIYEADNLGDIFNQALQDPSASIQSNIRNYYWF